MFGPYIKRSSRVLSFTLAAAATVAGTALARAGASDFDQASLLVGSSAAAKLKPLDPRLRAQVSEQPDVEQQTEEPAPKRQAAFGVLSGAWDSDNFLGEKFDVKIGAQSIDTEFMTSQSASYLLNSAMGWGALPEVNLPGGGPTYPLASLGVRGDYKFTDAWTVLGGFYSGSPLPAGSDGSQPSNPSGIALPLNTGALAIAEFQYRINGGIDLDPDHPDKAPDRFAGTYKLGAWYDSESFDDLRYDSLGLPLASDFATGVPASHHGNYSIYALADQMIWRQSAASKRYLTAFVRPMFTTLQDRSLVSFSINGGLALHQPFNRANGDNDLFALGFGVAQVSTGAANFDRDMQFYHPDVFTPVQGAETFLEVTYQAQILPSVVVQPDIQYIVNPAGGIANPNAPWEKVKKRARLRNPNEYHILTLDGARGYPAAAFAWGHLHAYNASLAMIGRDICH